MIEQPRYPWHFSAPYMVADWGDVVELLIRARASGGVGGEVTER